MHGGSKRRLEGLGKHQRPANGTNRANGGGSP
jgi:hypothetical protein